MNNATRSYLMIAVAVGLVFGQPNSTHGQSAKPRKPGTYWSAQNPKFPPFPFNPFPQLPVFELAPGQFIYDDREVDYAKLQAEAAAKAAATSPGPSQRLLSAADYGCGLWLEVSVNSPTNLLLTLHNTLPGTNYQILSKTSIAATSWTNETNVAGASGQTDTQVIVPILQRSNLFFVANEVKDYAMETNYEGLSFADTQIEAPDTMGAVGRDHFVECLNGKMAVFNKTNGQRIAEEWITNVFAITVGGTNYPLPVFGYFGDPHILYDHQSNRWVASALDIASSNYAILAISHDASPLPLLSNWTKHLVTVAPYRLFCDYDTLGMDANGIYISVVHPNNYPPAHTVVAIKKPDIYLGQFHATLLTSNDISNLTAIQPAMNFDYPPLGGHAWFVVLTDTLHYRRLQWNGTNAIWADSNWRAVPDSVPTYRDYQDLGFAYPPVIAPPQVGGTNHVDLVILGSRLLMSVVRGGFLYTCHHVGLSGTNGTYCCDEFGGDVDRTGVQWFKLQTDTNDEPLTIYDHGRIYDTAPTNTHWYYFPSMMVNCAGDMAFGFSGSSATNYISAYYAWRPASGSPIVTPRLIQPGLGYYNATRWGDYSYTSLDPADGVTFWTVQQYALPANALWSTAIAIIKRNP